MKTLIFKKNFKKITPVKFIVLLGLVLFGNTIVFGQNDVNTEIKRSLAIAKTAYGLGEYQDALNEYLNISKLAPDFSDIYKAIGDTYVKIGGVDNLKMAIENYNHYLLLSPNAEDKDAVQEKIFQLEYLFKKQAQQDFILDDINGLWISNLVNVSDKKQREASLLSLVKNHKLSQSDAETLKTSGMVLDTCYRVDMKSTPLLFFKITEMGKTGKYRVEILKESSFYKESIIQKVVNIIPDKNNTIQFAFADEERYIPSQSKWGFLRFAGSVAGQAIGGFGGQIAEGLTSTLADAGSESDIPSRAQTVYNFELQYNNGLLTGYCNVIQKSSSAKAEKETQNDYYEISFWKDNDYLKKLQQMKDNEELEKQRKKTNKLVSFGFFGGLNFYNNYYKYYNVHGTNDDVYHYESSLEPGIRFGVFLEFRLSNLLSIQPGVTLQGGVGDVDIRNPVSLEVPINLLFKYNFNRSKLYAGAGPVINAGGVNTNVGLNLKAGYSFRAFFMEFGYNSGSSYYVHTDYGQSTFYGYDGDKVKFSIFSTSLGFRF